MHDEETNSYVKIFANITISFIGAGILGLPYAFKEVSQSSYDTLNSNTKKFRSLQGGLVEGAVIMAIIGAIRYCLVCVVQCCIEGHTCCSYSTEHVIGT